jgi:tetratricopeptide (TPR) repeat protein
VASEARPRLFIASSKEAIDIAYATRQNLRGDAEVTVWSEGVFQLSATSVESLELGEYDFGVFVFAPNDALTIRGNETASVRDNVIFELGLFVGRLGKNRCFVFVPEATEMHIPTDLVGLTPARYEINRSDGNNEAACGAACHEVRLAIKKLGAVLRDSQGDEGSPDAQETNDRAQTKLLGTESQTKPDEGWSKAFLEKDYHKAASLLEKRLEEIQNPKERIEHQAFLGLVRFQQDPVEGVKEFERLLEAQPNAAELYSWFAYCYFTSGRFDKALDVLDRGIVAAEEKPELLSAGATILQKLGKEDAAKEALRDALKQFPNSQPLYLHLAAYYTERKLFREARNVLVTGIQAIPHSETLLSKYAELLGDNGDHVGAVSVYQALIQLSPENPRYHSLLGNAFLSLELNSLSYEAYRTADELASSKEAWIVGNIANLLTNRGFHAAAVSKFNEALKLDPDSQYSHERLAMAMKRKIEEDERLQQLLKTAPPVFMLQEEVQVPTITNFAAEIFKQA